VSDACFSAPTLALLAPIVAAIVAGFGLLYRNGVRAQDSEIAYLRSELSDARNDLTEATLRMRAGSVIMDEAETTIRDQVKRRR